MSGLRVRIFLSSLLLCAAVIAGITLFSARETQIVARDVQRVASAPPNVAPARAYLQAYYRRVGSWRGIASALANFRGWFGTDVLIFSRDLHFIAASQPLLTGARATRRGDQLVVAFTRRSQETSQVEQAVIAIDLQPNLLFTDRAGNAVGFMIPLPEEPVSVESSVQTVNRRLWLAALVSLAAAVLISVALSRYLLKPITALTLAAHRLSGGDFSQRVEVRGSDELTMLAASFNTMVDALENAERLRSNMTSDIAHELGTPLHNLQGQIEALQDGLVEPTPQILESLHEETIHLSSLVAELAELSLADAGKLTLQREPIMIADLLASVKRALEPQRARKRVNLLVRAADDLPPLVADYRRLRQTLINVVSNALRHTPDDSTVRIEASAHDGSLQVVVHDQGSGLREGEHAKVFDRFYRADPSRDRGTGGHGIGLAIAKRFVEAHGGTIWASNDISGGALFTVSVPLHSDEAS
ncbi:MAG: ATP-binding protein [Candidatus Eremiobacteraeota bacterium]|nr:ATP-binding protein [Candidatus Eremiobacteraeota bacterium]